jgi:hypothetical protein
MLLNRALRAECCPIRKMSCSCNCLEGCRIEVCKTRASELAGGTDGVAEI